MKQEQSMGGHPLADWLEVDDASPPADQDEPDGRPRRTRLMVLGAIGAAVWLVAGIVLTLSGRDSTPTTASGDVESRAGEEAEPGDHPETASSNVSFPAAAGEAETLRAAAAQATVALRLSVSRTAADGEPARYVDVAVVEGFEEVGDVRVVRLLAVVLEGSGDGWTDTRVQRFAVPLTTSTSGEHTLAGAPWPLPAPDELSTDEPTWATHAEPREGIAEALTAAGFSGVTALATSSAEGLPVVRATFTADGLPNRPEVWLTDGPVPRVLGTSPRALDDETDRSP